MEPAFDFVAIGFGAASFLAPSSSMRRRMREPDRILPGVRHDFWAAGRPIYRRSAVAWYIAVTETTA